MPVRRAMGVRRVAVVVATGIVLAACGGSTGPTATPTPAANDQLGSIQARGTLVVSTDPEYPPQSFALEGASRAAASRCASNQMTASQLDGFDVQTAVLRRTREKLEALEARLAALDGGAQSGSRPPTQ